MKEQPQNQALGASETTRFFCTRISSAASAVDKFKKHRKEPNMATKNMNPVGGKTAVPADINNAQPAYFPKPHLTWEGQHPRCPQPPKSSYLKNSTITSVNFHSSKDPSPEVPDVPYVSDLAPSSFGS